MIVSWNWLKQYVRLDLPVEELARRLTMAGLNHEGTKDVAGDLAIDLEVTSNRPDCLGHIGVAREVAAVLDRDLTVPSVDYRPSGPPAGQLTQVQVQCPELCPRYVARVIRGVRIGPSPDWLRRRLTTCGLSSINNVVDVTNYVLMEAAQPLHAFDYDKLIEHRIVVRRARPGESMVAISQKRYELTSDMCVIADAQRPVAIGGIMGGLETEVTDRTTNLLIEAAQFDPLSIRGTSRQLGLASESSYRFERGVDPAGVDWASRRCCQLIAELAGGEVAEGAVSVGEPVPTRPPILLRFSRIKQLLGIDIDAARVRAILARLGLELVASSPTQLQLRPPSWRADLEREIDLIEEVGRIHGYDHVPEDVPVPAASSTRRPEHRIDQLVRQTLAAAGLHETMTLSFVDAQLANRFRLWTTAPPLAVRHPSRKSENLLRQSLLPSLLAVRRVNQARGVERAELFELARVYLPRTGPGRLPHEPVHLGLVCDRDLRELKGLIEALLARLHVGRQLGSRPTDVPDFAGGRGAALLCDGQTVGFIGLVSAPVLEQFELRRPCTVAELSMEPLYQAAQLTVRFRPVPHLPAVERELSLIIDQSVPWAELESVVRANAGPYLEAVQFLDLYQGPPIAAGKKSVHFGLTYRAADRTLTRQEVEAAQQAIIAACRQRLQAELRGP